MSATKKVCFSPEKKKIVFRPRLGLQVKKILKLVKTKPKSPKPKVSCER